MKTDCFLDQGTPRRSDLTSQRIQGVEELVMNREGYFSGAHAFILKRIQNVFCLRFRFKHFTSGKASAQIQHAFQGRQGIQWNSTIA
jgi:hypothetical protein